MENADFKKFLEDLEFTLKSTNGFGLAAPQVGVNLRVIAVQVNMNMENKNAYKDMQEYPFTIMINPKIKFIKGAKEESEYEGCLSVPQIRGVVKRPTKIFVEYFTPVKTKVQIFARGYLARLIQHECDHLDGVLFLDKVEKGTFATQNMVREYNLKQQIH